MLLFMWCSNNDSGNWYTVIFFCISAESLRHQPIVLHKLIFNVKKVLFFGDLWLCFDFVASMYSTSNHIPTGKGPLYPFFIFPDRLPIGGEGGAFWPLNTHVYHAWWCFPFFPSTKCHRKLDKRHAFVNNVCNVHAVMAGLHARWAGVCSLYRK